MPKKIAVIGAGNMGGAIIKSIKGCSIIASDTDKTKLKKINVKTTTENREAAKNADVIILAVKPQIMDSVLCGIKDFISKKSLIISIAAGITTKGIEKALGNVAVIRVMPNTALLVGMGMSVMCLGRYATSKSLAEAKNIFSRMGEVICIKNEKLMDAVTAISGSGPAYLYYFVEGFIKSAERLGLSKDIAKRLVIATLKGSIALLDKAKLSPEELRRQVTSPGGTTESAIKAFTEKGLHGIIEKAAGAACRRSKELSR